MSIYGMNVIELSAMGIAIVLTIFFASRNLILLSKLRKNQSLTNQIISDKELLMMEIRDLNNKIDQLELQQTDGFVNFISTSRDWAYAYIETVQEQLVEFDKEIAPIIEWTNSFGTVLGEIAHQTQLQKIALAYEKIKSLLPNDNEKPGNLEQGEK